MSVRSFMARFRWPRWGGCVFTVQGVAAAEARIYILEGVRRELMDGSSRIVITQQGDRLTVRSERAKPNRTPFRVGIRHWWFRVRRGE